MQRNIEYSLRRISPGLEGHKCKFMNRTGSIELLSLKACRPIGNAFPSDSMYCNFRPNKTGLPEGMGSRGNMNMSFQMIISSLLYDIQSLYFACSFKIHGRMILQPLN